MKLNPIDSTDRGIVIHLYISIWEATEVKKEVIEPMVQGAAIGAVVLLIVIFWTGWVVTSGAADAEGKAMAKAAVV